MKISRISSLMVCLIFAVLAAGCGQPAQDLDAAVQDAIAGTSTAEAQLQATIDAAVQATTEAGGANDAGETATEDNQDGVDQGSDSQSGGNQGGGNQGGGSRGDADLSEGSLNSPPVPDDSEGYPVWIATRGEESLVVVNLSDGTVDLARLRLGDAPGIDGSDWGAAVLEPGQCVSAWQNTGNPSAPDGVSCEEVGERLMIQGRDRFWKEAFAVFYDDVQIGMCDNDPLCLVFIPVD